VLHLFIYYGSLMYSNSRRPNEDFPGIPFRCHVLKLKYLDCSRLNVVSTVHFQMRYFQKSPTNAHKLFHNSLFLKFPYTYFGCLNHHFQGVIEINMHRLIVITYMVIFIYVEYEWASIVHLVQYCKINYYKIN
jgi:hypothetical protein